MCEFCHEHGEGKKWYLEVKNYSEELYQEKLSAEQQEIVGASNRAEWHSNFNEWFLKPALKTESDPAAPEPAPEPAAEPSAQPEQEAAPEHSDTEQAPPLTFEEILRRRKVTHFGQVIPMEDVEKVFEMVDSITRFPCGCRYFTTGKADKRYCFGVAMNTRKNVGEFPDDSSGLEVLEKHEAIKLIRDFDKEGLMHSIWTGVTPYVIGVCNCDRDCGAYRDYIENDGIPSFFHAEYICQVNWDQCSGCKSCMKQCQFGAMFYSSALEKVYINEKKCFGCGVCRTACHKKAITLIPRSENPNVANIWMKQGSQIK